MLEIGASRPVLAQVALQPSPPTSEVSGLPTESRVSIATDQLPYQVGKGPLLGSYYLIRSEDSLASLHLGQGDIFDPLKDIKLDPSGDIYLTLSYDQRARYEYYGNGQFQFRGLQHQSVISLRESLGADLHLGDHLRIYSDLESGEVGGHNYGTPQPVNRNDLTPLQLFGEATTTIDAATVGVRAGRQEMVLGNGLLFAARDNTNIQQNYDGVRGYVDLPQLRVDAFFLDNVINHYGTFADASTPHQNYWGVYGSYRLPTRAAIFLDPMYVGYYNRLNTMDGLVGAEARSIFGGRLWGVVGPVDFDWTGLYQFGTQAGHDVSAYGIFTDTGYNLAHLPLKPRIGIHADVGSGGRSSDGTVHTFEPLNFSSIYFTEAPLLAPMNLCDLGVGLSASLTRKVRVQGIISSFWRYTRGDYLYNFINQEYPRTSTSRGSWVGFQPALRASWGINRHLLLVGQLAIFRAGAALTEAGGHTQDYASTFALFRF